MWVGHAHAAKSLSVCRSRVLTLFRGICYLCLIALLWAEGAGEADLRREVKQMRRASRASSGLGSGGYVVA